MVKPLPVINLTEVKARQVFQNLIENAYKYRDETKNSFVNIDWKEDNGFYQFSIQDNGIGIGQEHFDLVFEAFTSVKLITGNGFTTLKLKSFFFNKP